MAVADFDYQLPESLIAQRPAPGGGSRLLVLPASGAPRHLHFAELADLLEPGDLLVYNDTRVMKARLRAVKVHDARAAVTAAGQAPATLEVLLVEQLEANTWRAMLRPARRLRRGGTLRLVPPDARGSAFEEAAAAPDAPTARVTVEPSERPSEGPSDASTGGELFRLEWDRDIVPLLDRYGSLPLPPYITRAADAEDDSAYQTIFARSPGAVAAPTAGLHFDATLLDRLELAGIERAPVTLHVGPGTFRPVTADNALEHVMHRETYQIPEATVRAIAGARDRERQVIAVGTTVVRTLEAAADAHSRLPRPGGGSTALFITPGYRFRVVDRLITNFHLPRSTLLMLVCAFAGTRRVLDAYDEAVRRRYRFFSYGDAMLLDRAARSP
ncbi:MAG: tRNA preQ1(34) S-adenosylmethionine ribosyltransferase-isomerase QueA [Acidobacteria bacterium]|nr:MAG: tRNA preQ1(34) S-adenosylmethionine ribosyltransferase-isomerase QueA [Acidobacteriota bacterium]REK10338.1 MAG: tRNA preQ1(34) S-adenosylmethionine ribosyltransferase-isomerase QueA [Acidobacteriota bacterium]